MSGSPWNRNDKPPPSSRTRWLIWAALLASLALGGVLLSRAFPEQSRSGYDTAQLFYSFALVSLISSSVIFSRQFRAGEALRNIAIWAAIATVLVLGYLYKDVFNDIGARLHGELPPADPRDAGAHTVVLSESDGGSYYTIGEINGVRVKFLVDTGASDIVLSPDDAQRVGLDMTALNYSRDTETANGMGRGAPATVAGLAVGPIRFANVDVEVNQAPMGSSLLGMTFLRRLKSFEFRDRKLYLHW
jgi:aspartyl protease family protein